MISFGVKLKNDLWRLFIDSLKGFSFKNGNKYASVLIAHTVNHNESYENVELIHELIKYNDHN